MTTILDLPVEILSYISEFVPEAIHWKFFRDSNKVFKQTLPPRKNDSELFRTLISLEKCGYASDVKNFLLKNGFVHDIIFYENLIKTGNLSCLQYLINKNMLDKNANIFYVLAVKHGQLHILEWFIFSGVGCRHYEHVFRNEIYNIAIEYEQLLILEWAKMHSCPLYESVWKTAIRKRNLIFLEWLRKNNCPWNKSILASVIENEYIEILKWFRENNFHWDEFICIMAAKKGKLEILKWLRKHDCPWDERVCTMAVKMGRSEILMWAWTNGCPHNEKILEKARNANRKEIVWWLEKHGSHQEMKQTAIEKCSDCHNLIDFNCKGNGFCHRCSSYDVKKIFCYSCLIKCNDCTNMSCAKCIKRCTRCAVDICWRCHVSRH